MKPTLSNIVKLGSLIFGLLGCALIIKQEGMVISALLNVISDSPKSTREILSVVFGSSETLKLIIIFVEIAFTILSLIGCFRIFKNPKSSSSVMIATGIFVLAFNSEVLAIIGCCFLLFAGVTALVISLFFPSENSLTMEKQPMMEKQPVDSSSLPPSSSTSLAV